MYNHQENLKKIKSLEIKLNESFINIFIDIIERYALERNLEVRGYSLGGFLIPNNYNDIISMFNNFYNEKKLISHYYCKSNEMLEFLMYHNLVVDYIVKPRQYMIDAFKFYNNLNSLNLSNDDIENIIAELWNYYPYTKMYDSHMDTPKDKKYLVEYYDDNINQWSEYQEYTIIRKFFYSIENVLTSIFEKDSKRLLKEIYMMKKDGKRKKHFDDDNILIHKLYDIFKDDLNISFDRFSKIYMKNDIRGLIKLIFKDKDIQITLIK